MNYYPINVDLRGRSCLVVGGGRVGTRKAQGLLACGATVTVISPDGTDALSALADGNRLVWHRRQYRESDADGMFLIFSATDQESLNRRIHADAGKAGAMCNVADRPELCDFILPSVVRQGDLSVAISTGGQSPAVARQLRLELEKYFGPEYGLLLRLMGRIRKRLQTQHDPDGHRDMFRSLLEAGILDRLREGDIQAIDALLLDTFGPGHHYDELMNSDT